MILIVSTLIVPIVSSSDNNWPAYQIQREKETYDHEHEQQDIVTLNNHNETFAVCLSDRIKIDVSSLCVRSSLFDDAPNRHISVFFGKHSGRTNNDGSFWQHRGVCLFLPHLIPLSGFLHTSGRQYPFFGNPCSSFCKSTCLSVVCFDFQCRLLHSSTNERRRKQGERKRRRKTWLVKPNFKFKALAFHFLFLLVWSWSPFNAITRPSVDCARVIRRPRFSSHALVHVLDYLWQHTC